MLGLGTCLSGPSFAYVSMGSVVVPDTTIVGILLFLLIGVSGNPELSVRTCRVQRRSLQTSWAAERLAARGKKAVRHNRAQEPVLVQTSGAHPDWLILDLNRAQSGEDPSCDDQPILTSTTTHP